MFRDSPTLQSWLSGTRDEASSASAGQGHDELTPAELRTLQFLPSHLSFREIAERSFVSPNTVKTQAQAIYRKLDASSRAEAVDQARAMPDCCGTKPYTGASVADVLTAARARGGREGRSGEDPPVEPRGVGGAVGSAGSGGDARGDRTRRGCRTSCRSATGACSLRRSPSTAARRRSWRRTWPTTPSSGLRVQLCGDAHLSNFGGFAAPDRRLIFDINDFDETHPGPFEWDLKRLAASFAVAGRDLGFKASESRSAVTAAVREYREEMRRLASMRTIDVWYERLDVQALEQYRSQVSRSQARNFDKTVAKAESKNSLRAFDKLTRNENGEIRDRQRPALDRPDRGGLRCGRRRSSTSASGRCSRPTPGRSTAMSAIWSSGYRYVHAAHKIVGVGSVGTRAWILLLLGRDSQDPLFLQAKEAQSSVLEPYTGASQFKQQGRRVVEGQRLMQAASDIFLGWVTAEGPDGKDRDFYVRQLWDGKGSAAGRADDPHDDGALREALRLDLARAHARSGDRIAIAAYLGKGDRFDRAIGDFAEAYADQNDRDYKEFASAVKDGSLLAETDL